MYDVAIIGGGVVGSAIARELSRYNLNICLVERESDICQGTSKANSAIIHAGFDALPGTLKAALNVRGSQIMPELAKKLDFAYRNNQALVLCFDEDSIGSLEELYDRGIRNGVEGLEIIDGDKARSLEPSLGDNVVAALLAKTSAIVCPFEMNIAFAENAAANGVQFKLNTEVTGIKRVKNGDPDFEAGLGVEDEISGKEKLPYYYIMSTNCGEIRACIVINAAGLYADKIHNMVSDQPFTIIPRRGEYYLLDKEVGNLVDRTIFQLPTKLGKGVLITPTVHGNLLVGPTAENIEDKENTATTAFGLQDIKTKAALSVSGIPMNKAITNFSGLRAVGETGDFIIRESIIDGFIDVAGIESPGLSSAPAIGEYVAEIIKVVINRDCKACAEKKMELKSNFTDERRGVVHFANLTRKEQNELIKKEPAYGSIVCRCESITEGEILDAIRRPLGASTLDGVKRRTRAGMGRCQAGFCTPRVMEIISKECNIPLAEVSKN
ncbi:MAG: NAD(P)/FAD-dependent oxidoreductase [Eubacterium sp.]|nr:NAD(P)/FAD-dependent oxidoreductase [Eubacterium sp.]